VRDGIIKKLQTSGGLKFRSYVFFISLIFILYDGRGRATESGHTNSAIIAFVRIDSADLITFAFNDGSLGTFINATAAPNTILSDTMSHDNSPKQLRVRQLILIDLLLPNSVHTSLGCVCTDRSSTHTFQRSRLFLSMSSAFYQQRDGMRIFCLVIKL
jgi:hypothetical protein